MLATIKPMMMKITKLALTVLLIILSTLLFAQGTSMQTDSMKLAQYRTEIGLNLTAPDFNAKSIDATVMGTRLASILDYLFENYKQLVYNRKLCKILKEQNQTLEKVEFDIVKIQFDGAKKINDEITLLFTVWLSKNTAKLKQTELVFCFKNGVSESQATNELFSMMSHYVQQREQLQKQ